MREVQKVLLNSFESFLQQKAPTVSSYHPHFDQALKDMLNAGGKRFRPMLLLNVVEACSPLLVPNAQYAALALELLHTYSLIHDDLPAMDDADLRRGEPTLHVRYDEVTAILVGDALNTHAFYLLSKAPLSAQVRIKLVEILSRDGGTSGMIIGQACDCFFEEQKLSLESLEFLHENKTAKLIAASLLMGAVICDLDEKTQNGLYDFGLKLGLLFQIQDDIIDATKTSEEAGKPTNNDGNKNSFVNLLGLDGANNSAQKLLNELQGQCETFEPKLCEKLQNIILEYFKG